MRSSALHGCRKEDVRPTIQSAGLGVARLVLDEVRPSPRGGLERSTATVVGSAIDAQLPALTATNIAACAGHELTQLPGAEYLAHVSDPWQMPEITGPKHVVVAVLTQTLGDLGNPAQGVSPRAEHRHDRGDDMATGLG